MMTKLLACLVMAVPLAAYAADPVVSNVVASQRDGTNLVDVYYSLSDPDWSGVYVMMLVSTNSGLSFDVACPSIWGSVDYVITGATKHIVWNAETDLPGFATSQLCIRLAADDACTRQGVSYLDGAFLMGDCFWDFEFDEYPVHTAAVSQFKMERHEVSYALWSNVYTWAIIHGYAFDNTGAYKAATHPVQSVNWYDCIKWCNARSEKYGLTPCYYTSAAMTSVYRTGQLDLSNDWVRWTANGYRLPTEAEWEYSAQYWYDCRFPWFISYNSPPDFVFDVITHDVANYYSDTNAYSYDFSTTLGYHPTFATNGMPFTSPVGYFGQSMHGLYDMGGNVAEWCWDWYDSSWYINVYTNGTSFIDARGPKSGSSRVTRGGGWNDGATKLRCASRDPVWPGSTSWNLGFRCVRQ